LHFTLIFRKNTIMNCIFYIPIGDPSSNLLYLKLGCRKRGWTMTTFGKRLKQARGRRGLTQNQVAEMLGIDFTTLSKYENDKSQPDHQTLRELASMYEVSIDWLLTGDRLPTAGIP